MTHVPRSLLAMLVLTLSGGASTLLPADTLCYRGAVDSGELRFEFRIERSTFTGRFGSFQAEYCMERDQPETGTISVTVDLRSVNTGNRDLTIGIQEPEGLDVDSYPTARWTTPAIEPDGDSYRISGELTIRGVTRTEQGRFRLDREDHGWRLTGSAEIRRLDYQVGIGEFADTEFIPDEVRVEFDLGLRPP